MDESSSVGRRDFLRQASVVGGLSFAALRGSSGSPREAGEEGAEAKASDYDLDPAVTYLNHASSGTMPTEVRVAYSDFVKRCESNPWEHLFGGRFDEELVAARIAIAAYIGAEAADVALVRNTTEGFNLLASGLPLRKGDEVVFSSLNHVGASECFNHRALERGFGVRRFRFPTEDANLSDNDLVDLHIEQVTDQTRVLVIPHLDNRIGLRLPVDKIARKAKQRGVEFVLVDGAQAVGMFRVDVSALGVDAYATSAHKWLQAPKGTGILYLAPGLRERLSPLFVSWGQAKWKGSARAFEDYGTRDPALILALAKAVEVHGRTSDNRRQMWMMRHASRIRQRVEAQPKLTYRSPVAFGRGGSLLVVDVDVASPIDLANRLFAEHQIVVRGFDDEVGKSLRISPNITTSDGELDRALDAIARLIS